MEDQKGGGKTLGKHRAAAAGLVQLLQDELLHDIEV